MATIVYQRILSPLPHLPLIYERDLLPAEQHQTTASRIFAALDLPDAPVQTIYHKIMPRSLPDFIENYDELAAALRGTRYSRYLDEGERVRNKT